MKIKVTTTKAPTVIAANPRMEQAVKEARKEYKTGKLKSWPLE